MSTWHDIQLATQEGNGFNSGTTLSNMFLAKSPPGEEYPFAIRTIPALSTASPAPITTGSGEIRGLLVHNGTMWWVRGTELYYSTNGTSATLAGTVAGTAPVRIIGASATQIFIVDGAGNEYVATTGAVTAVTPPAGDFADCTAMDGYVICPRVGTDEFYISGLDDPTTFGALDFSTADAIPDQLVGCIASNRDLFLFGKKHTEVWYDAGSSPFPFQRTAVIERGLLARLTVKKGDGVVYFVGDDRRVYRFSGYTPEPISTEWVERELGLTDTLDAAMFASIYTVNGQRIYAVQYRNTGGSVQTVEYNITTGLWHNQNAYLGFRDNFIIPSASAVPGNAFHAGKDAAGTVGVYMIKHTSADSAVTYTMSLPYIKFQGRRCFAYETELEVRQYTGSGSVLLKFRDDDTVVLFSHSTLTLATSGRLSWPRCGSFRHRFQQFVFTGLTLPLSVFAARIRMELGQ
jgi:hypothetical protein